MRCRALTVCGSAAWSTLCSPVDSLLVTAQLLNTPVDTATRVVAELAGQKMVALDNVFYVTTKEHADNLAVERENWKSERRQIESTPVPNRAAGAVQ